MQIFRPELTKLSNNFLFNANIALQFERKMRYHGNAVHGRLLCWPFSENLKGRTDLDPLTAFNAFKEGAIWSAEAAL